ncbi:TOMM precursor leader peptide-binding protein [Dermatophilaceae bacterium Soc4.6]
MRVHILRLGAFGAAVATLAGHRLAAAGHAVTGGDVTVTPHAAPAFWPPSDLCVLVAGRPSPYLEGVLDRSVVDSGTPAATVVVEHPRLRLGPLVDGTAACLGCLHVRRAQHDGAHAKVAPLLQAYDRDPSLEPRGHLPLHVALAVTWLERLTQQLAAGTAGAGRVTHLNLHTGASGSDRIVGVHGCPRCRTTPPLADSTWRGLATDLVGVGGVGASRGGDRG